MCEKCDRAHKCPKKGMLVPIPCPIGKYQTRKKQTFCIDCPDRKRCNETELLRPQSCPRGKEILFIGPLRHLIRRHYKILMILGFECKKGIPRLCPANTFNRVKNGICQSCPPGGVTFEEGSIECIIVKVNLPSKPSGMVFHDSFS